MTIFKISIRIGKDEKDKTRPKHTKNSYFLMFVASLQTPRFVMFCVFLYGPFCHGAHKIVDVSLRNAHVFFCCYIFCKMGIDIGLYRIRIGLFTMQIKRGCKLSVLRVSRQSASVWLRLAVFLSVLTILGGDVELNPGPPRQQKQRLLSFAEVSAAETPSTTPVPKYNTIPG